MSDSASISTSFLLFMTGRKESDLFARNRFLGKNKQERPCNEVKRCDACPRKTIRDEQKSARYPHDI